MQRIRLRRVGRKNEPHYQVVVTPHTNSVKGNFTEKLGWYNPATKELKIDKEATTNWLNKGAQPSNTMAKLLIKAGVKHKLVVYIEKPPRKPKGEQKEESTPKKETKTQEPQPEAEKAEETKAPDNGPKEEQTKDNNQEEAK